MWVWIIVIVATFVLIAKWMDRSADLRAQAVVKTCQVRNRGGESASTAAARGGHRGFRIS
jgi:hypothetical protein